jgi:hypothetical protein
MHSMHNSTDTSSIANPVHPTFGPPRVPSRKPRLDDVLAEAVEIARAALEDFTEPGEVGEHLGATADDERVVTHRFVANVPGYRGWAFFATLARAPRSKVITISETGMLPGDNALLAPEWVPWMDRASEEERIRLDAIAAGEDPAKALEAAGFGPSEAPEPQVAEKKLSKAEQEERKKQARREAKRRRAKAARKKQQKSGKAKAAGKK